MGFVKRGDFPRRLRLKSTIAQPLAAAVLLFSFAGAALADPGDITLVSITSDGTKGNGTSESPAISAVGTRIVFASSSTNLISGDDSGGFDIYGKDLASPTGEIVLLSSKQDGTKGNSDSDFPSISADGNKVAFLSSSTNLDPADADDDLDVYVKDLNTWEITLASTNKDGVKGNRGSSFPSLSISADGTKVAFSSSATNLIPDDDDHIEDVYVKDLVTGEIILASVTKDGTKGDSPSMSAVLSADGTRVAFVSESALDERDTNLFSDVYVKDLITGDLFFASVSEDGTAGNNLSLNPSLSADGTKVAFSTIASNLISDDGDEIDDVLVKNLDTNEIVLVSITADGDKGDWVSSHPSLSADGNLVAFRSEASNLHPEVVDISGNLYLKVLSSGEIILVNTTKDGTRGNGGVEFGFSLSTDGTRIVFSSDSTNLDPNDSDLILDIYMKELVPPNSPFLRGDSNADGSWDISDVVFLIWYLFVGGNPPPCRMSADFDADNFLDINDAISLLKYLFQGGPAPGAPFSSCGMGSAGEALDCKSFPPCLEG